MLNGWIVYNQVDADKNYLFIEGFIEQAAAMDIRLLFKRKEDFSIGYWDGTLQMFYEGNEVSHPDFVISRNLDETFRTQLELMGIRVFNSATIGRIANNKARTHQLLAGHGIPMTDTLFIRKEEWNPDILPFSYPLIVKDANGRSGTSVFKVDNDTELKESLKALQGEILIQRPALEGKDVRVFVVGKDIVCAILRQSDLDFRANISLGGSSSVYTLNESEQELVHKILNILDLDYAGIDFIFDHKGRFLLNEIEDVVGSRSLFANTSINIYEIYLNHILKTINLANNQYHRFN
ncbi:ATP-grasp domain-containing protein [Peribacillus alkalitolerans]|uniref:ATP-grasp domain-containing protein n=1 Tax=Peribacillus alkalitolerans TaxID=1550385 RepID=UPI0013D6ADD0|nr:ATP-grasp domain-containing protein [Peribacillus alkalitolerans]